MRYLSFVLFLAMLCLNSACQKPELPHPPRAWEDPGLVDLSQEWTFANPGQYHISNSIVSSVLSDGASVPGLESIVIIKNGALIGERYFRGTSDALRHIRSCTKSVVSVLTGIALDSMYLEHIDQPIGDVIVPQITASLDTAKASVSIRHLLTMTSGFQWNESDFTNWIDAANQLEYLLQRPLSDTPGTKYNYSTPAVHLLGAILASASDAMLAEFADRHLFLPLAITRYQWETDKQGYSQGGTGLQLRTRDMAKLGYLMIQDGNAGHAQLVSTDYVLAAATNYRSGSGGMGGFTKLGYGYLWWTDSGQHEDAFIAWGYGGQFIYVVPAQFLVIAVTADWNVSADQDQIQSREISKFIVDKGV